jgi:hypothetical protein
MKKAANDCDVDALTSLQKWYASACDGCWEHQYGIRIDTLDNPGWLLHIDLRNTPRHKHFEPIDIKRSQNDWIVCKIENGCFEGFGGPLNLSEIIRVFVDWAEVD